MRTPTPSLIRQFRSHEDDAFAANARRTSRTSTLNGEPDPPFRLMRKAPPAKRAVGLSTDLEFAPGADRPMRRVALTDAARAAARASNNGLH
jgi:hypothetical protein